MNFSHLFTGFNVIVLKNVCSYLNDEYTDSIKLLLPKEFIIFKLSFSRALLAMMPLTIT